MSSLRETESGKFIYRCHACGCEIELTAVDPVAADDEAVACNQAHEYGVEMRPASTNTPKAS